MMPRTADEFANEQSFGERATVMRARRTHGEEFIATASEEHRFSPGVPRYHSSRH
jgi:hypothetical protein